MVESEVQSARKRRLWGKFYTRKCRLRSLDNGESGSLSVALSAHRYGCSLRTQDADACQKNSKNGYSGFLIESSFSQNRPNWAERSTAGNGSLHAKETALVSERDVLCLYGSNVGESSGSVVSIVAEMEPPFKSEACAVLCRENRERIGLEGGIENAVAPASHFAVRDDHVECKHRERVRTESTATLCTENGRQIELGGGVVNVVATSDDIADRDDTLEHKHQERAIVERIITLCTENGQQLELSCDIVNVVASSDAIAVRDDPDECEQQKRVIAESSATLPTGNGQQFELGGHIANVVALLDDLLDRDSEYRKQERAITEPFATLCTENGQQIELGSDLANVVAPLDLVAVRDDTSKCKHAQSMVAESIVTLCTENKPQVDLGGDILNVVAQSDDNARLKCPEIMTAESSSTLCTENGKQIECGADIANVVAPMDQIAFADDTSKCKHAKSIIVESIAMLCTKNKPQDELRGDIVNVVALSDDTAQFKHPKRMIEESISTLCTENKQQIKPGGDVANIVDPSDLIAGRGDIAENKHRERTIAAPIATLCTANGQHIELGCSIENIVAPANLIAVRDNTSQYEHHRRMMAESSTTFCTENKQHNEVVGDIVNVVTQSGLIAVKDDNFHYKHQERALVESIATVCTENKTQIELGGDLENVETRSDLIVVRDDTAECNHREQMITESTATLCTENKQQIELVGDRADHVVTSSHIAVRDDTTEYKHQERNMAEKKIPFESPFVLRRLDDKHTSWTVQNCTPSKDQNICFAEREENDNSMSDCIYYEVNGSPLITVGLVDKSLIKDQNIRQEHAKQVKTILSKEKPDETWDHLTEKYGSNDCGRYTGRSSLTKGESTVHLKCNEDFDDFTPQPLDNFHPNACQLIDHDNCTNRTGPILRSRKIYLATSVVKKHQRRMMASMSSEGGRSRKTTFINNRLKRNAVKRLLDNYLKDWTDRNAQAGISENEHCLPFLVHAPRRVECYQCKALVLPGKEVICTVLSCRRAYHLVCAKQLQACHWSKKKGFKCPQHVCMVCNSRHGLWRCVQCPVAVHTECSPWPEAMVIWSERPGPAICWRHHEDWRLEHKRKDRTNDVKEAFHRLPVPYFIEDFKIEAHFWQDVMGNENEPPPYVQIRRNVFLTKKKRDDTDDGVGCSCGKDAIVCGENCECRVQSMSCSKACRCSELCTNKPFRKDKRIKLVKTKFCGWGAEAAEVIKKGEFVIEYVGEVINDALCEARLWEMKHRGVHNFYMCEIGKDFVIDATFKGNLSRFLNHSCDPNCKLEKWRVDGETRVGVFAAKYISVGETLTYDYRFIQFGPNVKCHCGAANCQGDLGEPFGTNGIKTGGSRAVSSENFGNNNGIVSNLQMLQWGSKRKRSDFS